MATLHRIPVEETFSWQRPVISKALSVPPGSPVKGDRYIVKATGTGAWASHDNAIAWFDGSVWQFDAPSQGWTVYNKADSIEYAYSGSVWVSHDATSKQNLVPAAVLDNLASFDAAGQVKDSGVSAPVYDAALGALIISL